MKRARFLIRTMCLFLLTVVVHVDASAQAQPPELHLPLQPGTQWKITQGYNTDSHGGKNDSGEGVNLYALDFAVTSGSTDVVAAAPGTVWRRNDATLGGILIKHGDSGYYSIYYHMTGIRVNPDDQVDSGTPLGTVGSVGMSSGDHLHFAVVRRKAAAPYPMTTGQAGAFPLGTADWEPVPLSFAEADFPVLGDSYNQHFDPTGQPPAVPPAGFVGSSTVLVVDVSGSMADSFQGAAKIDSARQAALGVITMIEDETRVGAGDHRISIAAFTSDATLELDLSTNYGVARDVVEGLVPLDWTNIGAGIEKANGALRGAPPGVQKIIVLLSDGMTNRGLEPDEIIDGPVRQAADAGTCIFTIGFGDSGEIDEALLERISDSAPCGDYQYAGTPYELRRLYGRARHQALGQILGEFSGEVSQGERVTAGQIDVPPNQAELYASLYWPGSVLGLVMTDPQGQEVNATYPGASVSTYERMIYAIVQDPPSGAWGVDVVGQEVPAGVTNFDTILSSRLAPPTPIPPTATPLPPTPTATPVPVVEPPGSVMPAFVLLAGAISAVGLLVLAAIRGRQRGAGAEAGVGVAARLVVRGGELAGSSHAIGPEGLTLGRSRSSDVQLSGGTVSRNHATVRPARGGYYLQDQGSLHGTYVNGERVEAARLNDGDVIKIGEFEIEFHLG